MASGHKVVGPDPYRPIRQDFLLYLGGPVTGMSYGDISNWQAKVVRMLPSWIKPLSPLRGTRSYLQYEQVIAPSYVGRPLSTPAAIRAQCKFDVMRADMILFNFLAADRVSIGSCIELGWADMAGKPVVVVIDPGNPHEHPILNEIVGWRVGTLEEAVHIVTTVLTPGL